MRYKGGCVVSFLSFPFLCFDELMMLLSDEGASPFETLLLLKPKLLFSV
jgi:hypothetical protein